MAARAVRFAPLLRRLAAGMLALGGLALLGPGLTLPIVSVERLVFFVETPSILEILHKLLQDGEQALALILGAVSVVFPVFKGLGLVAAAAAPKRLRLIARILGMLGRFQMVDVVVVALAIFAAKASGLADAASQPGLWFYAASAVAAAASAALIRKA